MKIGILGTGEVGRSLGTGFKKLGHEVMIGSRDIQKKELQDWAKETGGKPGTFADATKFGEVVFICTGWSGTQNAIALAGESNLAGKVVVDVTNPLEFSTGKPRLAVGYTDSAGEQVQRWLPGSKVVKAFNIITAKFMTDGRLPDGQLDMFIAGNDPGAKETVKEFLTAFHWNTHDLGGIEQARLLEPFAMLWIWLGVTSNSWNHAFRLIRK